MKFKVIAYRWAKQTGEPADTMLAALFKAFWLGEFKTGDVYYDRAPKGCATLVGDDSVVVDESGRITDERERETIDRRYASRRIMAYSGPKYKSLEDDDEAWKEVEKSWKLWSSIPLAHFPSEFFDFYFKIWEIDRSTLVGWYNKSDIWPKPDVNEIWPGPNISKTRDLGMPIAKRNQLIVSSIKECMKEWMYEDGGDVLKNDLRPKVEEKFKELCGDNTRLTDRGYSNAWKKVNGPGEVGRPPKKGPRKLIRRKNDG
jgi:hypothetical protein